MKDAVPSDIAAAIDALKCAAEQFLQVPDDIERAREALDATILHHLRAYDEMKAALELQASGAA